MCSALYQPVPDVSPVPRRLRVNIIGKSNGVGLARDIDLLVGALRAAGHRVNVTIIDAVQAKRRRSPLAQFAHVRVSHGAARKREASASAADLNVMLEHVWLQYLSTAPVNVAVPNPEWFDSHDRRFVTDIDNVWAKTTYTQDLFRALGCKTSYIGFDSEDRYERAVAKQRTYFHLAGKSTMKGTDRLVRLWQRHPEWPRLILVQHQEGGAAPPAAPNIDARVGYFSEQELRRLQNESLFHLCLSLTEGWGHYIAEAMSVGAVTITVDARPMNELVGADRGVLVPFRGTGTQHLATTYLFDEGGLEAAIERTIAMSDEECARLGAAARAWFVENKSGFTSRIEAALLALDTRLGSSVIRSTRTRSQGRHAHAGDSTLVSRARRSTRRESLPAAEHVSRNRARDRPGDAVCRAADRAPSHRSGNGAGSAAGCLQGRRGALQSRAPLPEQVHEALRRHRREHRGGSDGGFESHSAEPARHVGGGHLGGFGHPRTSSLPITPCCSSAALHIRTPRIRPARS